MSSDRSGVDGFPFTDADGRHWLIVDYHTAPDRAKRQTKLGAASAECRAFVPESWSGAASDVMVYRFGATSYRLLDDVTAFQSQLDSAYPSTATQLDRMQPKPPAPDRREWKAAQYRRMRGEQ